MATVLVTGATGYIGRHLVPHLTESAQRRGDRVRVLVRRSANLASLAAVSSVIDVFHGDVTDLPTVRAAMQGVDQVVHLAALTANVKERPGRTYAAVNAGGARNVAEAARAAGTSRIIMLSGIGCVADGERSWIRTRWDGEEAVRHSGVPCTIIQPSVLFGDGGEFFVVQARVVKMAPIAPIIGSPTFKYQPIWVEDVCTCIVKALSRQDLHNQTVAIGGPQIMTAAQVIDAIQGYLGTHKPKVAVPVGFMRLQATLLQAILPTPPLTTATLELFSLGDNITDLDAVPRLFGFNPRALSEHLKVGQY